MCDYISDFDSFELILHLLLHHSDELRLLGVTQHFLLGLMTFLQSGSVLLWFGTEDKSEGFILNHCSTPLLWL